MKKYLWDYAYLLGVAAVIIALDQWTKYLVRTYVPFRSYWSPFPWLVPYARIVHIGNDGAAFGMLQGFGGVFTILAILVALAILYYFPRVPGEDWYLRLAMGLQFGGAVGNLIDRLTQGYVTDFISVGNFAVFNIADASISIGVAVLIIGFWIKDRQEKAAQKIADRAAQPPTGEPLPIKVAEQDTISETSPKPEEGPVE